jgi:excisionase family DNA binding protein
MVNVESGCYIWRGLKTCWNTLMEKQIPQPLTISVPEAGRRLGIGRNTAYEAARLGQLPVIRIGKRMVVPIAAFEAMLAIQSKQQSVAAELVRRLQGEPA